MATRVYSPLPERLFRFGGGPAEHATRAIGNWWSDHAVDLMAPAMTSVIAVERLTVSSVTRRPSTGTGVNDGSTVFATGASGERYAFLHLDPAMLPVPGQRINAGAPFARIAAGTAGGPHLHFASQNADPVELTKQATGESDGGSPFNYNPLTGFGIPDAAGDAAGAVAGAAGAVADGVMAVPRFLAKLVDPHNILRALQILAGAVLVLAGIVLLARQVALAADLPDPVTVATRGAVPPPEPATE